MGVDISAVEYTDKEKAEYAKEGRPLPFTNTRIIDWMAIRNNRNKMAGVLLDKGNRVLATYYLHDTDAHYNAVGLPKGESPRHTVQWSADSRKHPHDNNKSIGAFEQIVFPEKTPMPLAEFLAEYANDSMSSALERELSNRVKAQSAKKSDRIKPPPLPGTGGRGL